MGSLLFTDFDGVNRDAKHLQERLAVCAAAMKKACGDDDALYRTAWNELSCGEFEKKGSKLRMVAEQANVLAQVADLLPLIKTIDFSRQKPYLRLDSIDSHCASFSDCRTYLLESRLRNALEQLNLHGFEQELEREKARRGYFLKACNDIVRHDAQLQSQPFDALELHTGAGLAHNRVVSNRTLILPHLTAMGTPIQSRISPWFLDLIDDKIAGYSVGYGFIEKKIHSSTKTCEGDPQERSYWYPGVSIDIEIYDALMQVRHESRVGKQRVDDVLNTVAKLFKFSGHDYLHHTMYPLKDTAEKNIHPWSDFETGFTPFRESGGSALIKHAEVYRPIESFSETSTHEFFCFVMHRRILHHLFNSKTIDGEENVRGPALKKAIIGRMVKFVDILPVLRTDLEQKCGEEKAGHMTEYFATLAVAQMALIIGMDDKDMKPVYDALTKHKIYEPYTLPQEALESVFSRYSGVYKTPGANEMTRAFLEQKPAHPKYRYMVESLKKWSADAPADQALDTLTLKGEAGIKARILTSPWGQTIGWLHEPDLGKDFCPRVAHSYYDAFMKPELIESKAFKAAAAGYGAAAEARRNAAPVDYNRS